MDKEMLLNNLDKLHTTDMGVDRIKNNLGLVVEDVVEWCKQKIENPSCQITRSGKNWYAEIDNCIITVNAHSYTMITAHKVKPCDINVGDFLILADSRRFEGNVEIKKEREDGLCFSEALR